MGSTFFGLVDMGLLGSPMGLLGLPSLISYFILFSFHKGDHGDDYPFNGAGGSIAHAFSPTDGRFHYDADEQWSVEATPGVVSYETVALHEIGHLLGLEHSSVEGAIMWSKVRSEVIQGLHRDDIDGIKALYNF